MSSLGYYNCRSSDKTKSNFTTRYVIKIEGKEICIELAENGNIRISRSPNDIINEIPKDKIGSMTEFKFEGHNLKVRYNELDSLLNLLFWNSGFTITVDGKPVEKTVGDPMRAIEWASLSFFVLAGITIFSVFLNPDSVAKIAAICLMLVSIIFGFFTKKFPLFTTSLGSLYGIFDIISYLHQAIDAEYYSKHMPWFIFWLLLRSGIAFALIQGFFAAIRIRTLKRKPGH